MSDEEHEEPTPRWFLLEKKAMVAELRLLIIASVALNQFLSQVEIPAAITIPALGAAVLAPLGKALLTMFTHN